MGPKAAVFADHVELSDDGIDFASGIGAGGIPSTKFIWPEDESVKARLNEVWDLPAEKKASWQKWFDLYNQHRPAEGEYLNLYDLAFDTPETHVLRKGEALYYAFYAQGLNKSFSGSIQLRGLDKSKTYRVWDYVAEQEIARVDGSNPVILVTFKGALLVKVLEG